TRPATARSSSDWSGRRRRWRRDNPPPDTPHPALPHKGGGNYMKPSPLVGEGRVGGDYLFTNLSVAVDDPLGAGQLAEAGGASGVELVGADADLGAEAELAAVVEPGAGVDHHGRAVPLGHEPPRGGQVAGHDRVGVARAVPGDVPDGLGQ